MRSRVSVALTLALLGHGATLQAAPILSLIPSASHIPREGAVEVALRIEGLEPGGAPSLGAFDVDVIVDPGILTFAGVVFGDPLLGPQLALFGPSLTSSGLVSPGRVNLLELSFDWSDDLDAFQADAFTLATLTFIGTGFGTTAVGVAVNGLSDSTGFGRLEPSLVGAEVTTVPEPSTVLLLLSGAGACAAGARRRRQGH